jgi:hypothetical protein
MKDKNNYFSRFISIAKEEYALDEEIHLAISIIGKYLWKILGRVIKE